MTFLSSVTFAQEKVTPKHKTNTINYADRPKAIITRRKRMAMQQRQVKYHEKQVKKADSVQKKVKKEQHSLH